jgi:putative hemolysin
MNSISNELLVLLLLLLTNGILAMAEAALISARKSRLREMAESGDKQAASALEQALEPARFLSTVQVGITLIAVLAGAFGGGVLTERFTRFLLQFPALESIAGPLALGIVVVGITLASVVLGELVPKRIALLNSERIAMMLVRPIKTMSRIVSPAVSLLTWLTELALRPFGLHNARSETPVTEEEVNILVEQGMTEGVFNESERDMVAGVLELDEMPVTYLMTPRPKLIFLDSSEPTQMRHLLTPPLMVPETMVASQLLEKFKVTSKHVALVADEFGAVAGIVTLYDVLEAIVGDIPDPGENDEPEAKQRADGSWLIDASYDVDDLKELTDLEELPHEEETEFQTLGGFLMTQFGRIPSAGDCFDHASWRFEVLDMDRHRIDKVLVSKITEDTKPLKDKADEEEDQIAS